MIERRDIPAIARTSQQVLVAINEAVHRFPRGHRYVVGSDLRRVAMAVRQHVERAWFAKSGRARHLQLLSDAIDELKLTLELAQDLRAFGSLGQFEAIMRSVVSLGQQCGGWRKDSHSMGQIERGSQARAQRAPILSARDAPQGANP